MDAENVAEMTDGERFELASRLATDIRNALPKELYAGAYTLHSKLPFKADSLREVLIHRVSDLADVALELFTGEKLVPAFIITRSVVETTALIYRVDQKSKEFISNRDERTYDEFLMKGLLGSRDGTTPEESHNILTAIQHLDKEFGGLSQMYATLCEFTHPNYSGAMGSYSRLDKENHVLLLGSDQRRPPLAFGLGPLIGCLAIFTGFYNEAGEAIAEINNQYEKDASSPPPAES
jgi:hypothetical protein